MKFLNTTNHLTGSVLAVLACASFLGCSRGQDTEVMNGVDATTTSATTQSASEMSTTTRLAQNDMEAPPTTMDNTGAVPPMAADESTAKSETKSQTKSAKQTKSKHKAKKHHKKDSAMIEQPAVIDQDEYVYDSSLDADNVIIDEDLAAVDASNDFEDATVSGVSSSASMNYYETGLSPFAQEPASRFPVQIGSGQMTGEDRSTTVLDGPSLFQDPSALGRDLIH